MTAGERPVKFHPGIHDGEIETMRTLLDKTAYRVSCSCGFLGPWRLTRRIALRDRDEHEDRRAAGEA